jgi:hypothetical protein
MVVCCAPLSSKPRRRGRFAPAPRTGWDDETIAFLRGGRTRAACHSRDSGPQPSCRCGGREARPTYDVSSTQSAGDPLILMTTRDDVGARTSTCTHFKTAAVRNSRALGPSTTLISLFKQPRERGYCPFIASDIIPNNCLRNEPNTWLAKELLDRHTRIVGYSATNDLILV